MLYCRENDEFPPLPLDEYQRQAILSDQNKRTGVDGLKIPLLGLFGEMGSLLTLPKRKDRETSTNYRVAVIEEVGDVLWYLSNLASRQGMPLSALTNETAENLRIQKTPSPALAFSDLKNIRVSAPNLDLASEADYFALGGVVGRLMSEVAAGHHWDLDSAEFTRSLATTFRLLVHTAQSGGIDLNFCAHNNLLKISSRWPVVRSHRTHFDNEFDAFERLPRHIEMRFEERDVNGNIYVFQSCNGINIGDRLTDNRTEADDYRFHDVFHIAYATFLSWSPVLRALFKVKRKSSPAVDENEDGARAILIEEGLATWIFNHGKNQKLFEGVEKVDYSLLKAIRQLVDGYEVEQCALWQWEQAILEGFGAFRVLKERRGGYVVADLDSRTLVVNSL